MTRLPSSDSRTAITGSTGSGKTQFSAWLVSTRDLELRPWIIFDFKGDKLLAAIYAKEISLRKLPTEPGLYIVRPLPGDEMAVSNFFYRIWQQENVGVYVDEGYMLPKNDKWVRACLTQGRSKNVEMIICSQRPVFLDKFIFTESTFFAIFNLNYIEDRKHVRAYLNDYKPDLLPRWQCLWYDVTEQRSNTFLPVPEADALIEIFRKRLEKKPHKI